MYALSRPDRIPVGVTLLPLILTVAACGSSATTATAPSTITRCAVAVQEVTREVPAEGGTGSVTVSTTRECTWTVTTEGQWLTIRGETNGQGDGTVQFAAAPNPDPAVRRGALILNNQRAEIVQAAAECQFSLAESAGSFGSAGGPGEFGVRASSAMCSWTAVADADWIEIRTPGGQGNGTVRFDVRPATGTSRSAVISVAGQRFSVIQAEGCTYAISPLAQTVTPAGGSGSVEVTTAAGCPWTASSNTAWLTVQPASGSGPGPVTFSAAATSGPARTATAIIAGQTFTLTQAQGCTYEVRPASESVAAAGGTVTVTVRSAAGCPWTASSSDSWLSIQGASSGTGDGTVTLLVAATTGPARSASATIAGQRVTISQGAGCSIALAPQSANAPAEGGSGTVRVTTADGCAWRASSNASWATISAGSSGTGSGDVRYTVAASGGPARSTTLDIGGQTFTLSQGEGCAYTASPAGTSIGAAGGTGSFEVRTSSGCTWQASSRDPWITVTSGAAGTGNGTVGFSVARNDGAPRSGTIAAGGATFTVEQGRECSWALSAASHALPAAGGAGSVDVIAGDGCPWTAVSDAPWLTITSGASGSGNGAVGFSAGAHTGPARTGTLTIAGHTFTVTQAGSCTYALGTPSLTVSADGGHHSVIVTTDGNCGWTAVSQAPWLQIIGGTSSGQGSGEVRFNVERNATGAPRSGAIVIAGQAFTVNQQP